MVVCVIFGSVMALAAVEQARKQCRGLAGNHHTGSIDPPARRGRYTGMFHLILVAVGGAIGAALRHLVNLGSLRLVGTDFPWGTMAINIAGSLAMGVFIELLARRFNASNELQAFHRHRHPRRLHHLLSLFA